MTSHAAAPLLTTVAAYRRSVGVGLARVWENVLDWEHLPWLHAGSFRSIACDEAGDRGWRATVGLPDGTDVRIELAVDDSHRYVTRTLDGPGAGSEIWTQLAPHADGETGIEVAFQLPGIAPAHVDAVGRAYVALYERLWDEDEAMMRRRDVLLAAPPPAAPPPDGVDLGPEAALRSRLPLVVDLGGRPWRIVEDEGALRVHAATCPHWLGPLDEGPCEGGVVTCPWHGYRFDVRSGRSADGRALRLPPPPAIAVDPATGHARLLRR